jgi:hypothetical protein
MTGQDALVGFLINVVFGLIPATIAKRKGYPFMGWWVLCTLFSFVVILIIALFVKRRLPPGAMAAGGSVTTS